MSGSAFRSWMLQATRPHILGMVHVRALPGTSMCNHTIQKTISKAREEAILLADAGVDGLIIENMHDLPYIRNVGPEVTACMTAVCAQVSNQVRQINKSIKLGVQILAAANREAMSVAAATDMDFIRCEGFVFGHVADEGYIDACAGDLLRFRRMIGAEHVAVIADIKKKHCSHAITADVSLQNTAAAASLFLADGVVLTGDHTGHAADTLQLNDLRAAQPDCAVAIGSGVTVSNVGDYAQAHALIVGSHFKKEGLWSNEICELRLKNFMRAMNELEE